MERNSHDHVDTHLKKQPKEINLREISQVIKRYILFISLIIIITTTIGAYYTSNTYKPIYQSSTRLIIGADSQLMSTLLVIIRDTTVLDKVVKKLELPYTSETLSTKISANIVEGSQVVTIGVTDSDPSFAAKIANTTAETFKEELPSILNFSDVKVLSPAKINPVPINEKSNQGLLLSLIGGIVIGIGCAFLKDSLNNSVRKEEDVEELLGIPVIGTVSKMSKANMYRRKKKQNSIISRGETIGS